MTNMVFKSQTIISKKIIMYPSFFLEHNDFFNKHFKNIILMVVLINHKKIIIT